MDGRYVSDLLQKEIVCEVSSLPCQPGLAVVLVGDDPASQIYVKHKVRVCERVGMRSKFISLPNTTSQRVLLDVVSDLNQDNSVHGILVQLPLPKSIQTQLIIESISPDKDVDGFHPYNVGRLSVGHHSFLPCTPRGVLYLLDYYNIPLSGKRCVVVGASNIVGKPLALLLLQRGATVTVCNSLTRDLPLITRTADILFSATGCPHLIGSDSIACGAVVVDIGIHRGEDGKIVGDVDFEACLPKASYITPVPGGIGPMTIAMLLKNTLQAVFSSLGRLYG
ncbi:MULTISPECIES: bifunctional 5,10-methylenetetrahydrofolate dehydrogenase/5,10-methenyltetrahydrofolate cyclohydrolase [Candidatus Ichthyocystis]|uniref:bifunctional 5,10-methylenetetrahydrofolate dehydrogenase/5,10-methenyltetrahydrofolate cyclohydrolase n=1 Tax=Candidatus Ichthyocystis TaxID=2929841 RepID=UPI000A47162C|nr:MULTISPECIES: bifunctional 5,10-methylenetetrahydrofolate dehydrogenase/5,10-methenyltetrahydrofolate cyclohydrolase [Ichthyocystis]